MTPMTDAYRFCITGTNVCSVSCGDFIEDYPI